MALALEIPKDGKVSIAVINNRNPVREILLFLIFHPNFTPNYVILSNTYERII